MAKKTDKDKTAEETAPAEEAQAPAQQQVELQVNDDEVICSYSNFCRVTGSPGARRSGRRSL